ncbi:MAG: metallophosphoesterase [Bacilli bacterium]|nr:metallophosphoesterase [Bacilli bacterium]
MKEMLASKRNEAEVIENNKGTLVDRLINLIDERKSNQEICEELDIESQELYKMLVDLKENGREIVKKYYSDGSIHYGLVHSLDFMDTLKSLGSYQTIFSDSREKNMKFLLISDLHFGNKLDRVDLVNRAFDYCIKNDINVIICGGDLIDGSFTKGDQRISDIEEQLQFFLENYPHDDNILTFSVAGDHDASAIKEAGINISRLCNTYRPDVVVGGFANMGINIKNDLIMVHHSISDGDFPSTRAPIILHGHSHAYKLDDTRDKLDICLPSLSDIQTNIPSALELEVEFKNKYFSTTSVKQIYFGEKDIILGEAIFDLYSDKRVIDKTINNEEYYKKEHIKALQPMSQIDKFNNRWNRNK